MNGNVANLIHYPMKKERLKVQLFEFGTNKARHDGHVVVVNS